MLTDIINRLQDKMITDLKRILREMSIQEARKQISVDQDKLRRRHCYDAHRAAYEIKSRSMKSKRTKNR